jgi:hypothetical protein
VLLLRAKFGKGGTRHEINDLIFLGLGGLL